MPLLNDLPCKVFDESTNVEDSQDVQPTQSASRSLESSLSFSVVLDVANVCNFPAFRKTVFLDQICGWVVLRDDVGKTHVFFPSCTKCTRAAHGWIAIVELSQLALSRDQIRSLLLLTVANLCNRTAWHFLLVPGASRQRSVILTVGDLCNCTALRKVFSWTTQIRGQTLKFLRQLVPGGRAHTEPQVEWFRRVPTCQSTRGYSKACSISQLLEGRFAVHFLSAKHHILVMADTPLLLVTLPHHFWVWLAPLARVHLPASIGCYDLPADLRVLVSSSSVDPPPSPATTESGRGRGRRSDRSSVLAASRCDQSGAVAPSCYQPFTLGVQTENTLSDQWQRTGQGHGTWTGRRRTLHWWTTGRGGTRCQNCWCLGALRFAQYQRDWHKRAFVVHSSTLRCLLRDSAHPPSPPSLGLHRLFTVVDYSMSVLNLAMWVWVRRSDRSSVLAASRCDQSGAVAPSSYQPFTLGVQTENTLSDQWQRTGQGTERELEEDGLCTGGRRDEVGRDVKIAFLRKIYFFYIFEYFLHFFTFLNPFSIFFTFFLTFFF